MFKRFSPNYMALLLLLNGAILQAALWWLAMQLRYRLPYGQEVRSDWIPEWVFAPTPQLHLIVAILWLASFLVSAVYTPRHPVGCSAVVWSGFSVS